MKKIIIICFCLFLFGCSKKVDNIATTEQKYEVRFIVDSNEYEKIECNGNETITLPNEPKKEGFEFDGWFYEETFDTEFISNSLASKAITSDINVYAKWLTIYTITYTNTKGATYSNPTSYNVETNTITLDNLSKDGYEFDGWYNGNKKVTEVAKGSTGNLTLEARWSNYKREDNYIYFGEYPQTEVSDETIIASLTTLGGTLPTSTNSQTWTSYGYYQGTGKNGTESNTTNYMWYKDVTYNDEQYRGVYFTSYRPYRTYYSSSIDNSYQDDNGYETSNVYWFKFEPIKWRILKEANNEALLLCEMIIDSQEFYINKNDRTIDSNTIYANNWEYSTIRSWLKENFYNTAFNTLQQELIITQTLDNKTTAYYGSSNPYATCQNNTEDKIYLLSYQDMLNVDYGFITSNSKSDATRQKTSTDYAKVQGTFKETKESEFLGKGRWVLRSAFQEDCYEASYVASGGFVLSFSYYVYDSYYGIAPVVTIKLA